MASRPIGVLDSGVGGLTVVLALRRTLPHESILYYADTAHCPYGEREPGEVCLLAVEAARWLLSRRAKLLVVACNTASAAALTRLRREFAVPIVGMVPAVKPASLLSRTGKVGVLATPATVHAELFARLVQDFAAGIDVHVATGTGLVELVEAGEIDTPRLRRTLRSHLAPLLEQGIDMLVLGCTHFPFLRPAIGALVGSDVQVLDTGEAVARQVSRMLDAHRLAGDPGGVAWVRYHCTGDRRRFLRTVRRLLAATDGPETDRAMVRGLAAGPMGAPGT
ncbi:MAG: glutamate racemase [Chloroflexi bacterium]|nr:glutamate racemase [Chloroflexota bacterium]